MTTPSPNNSPDNNFLSGPPMVKIDGAAVRRIREEHGLTQLYVATVVQVTTDTISRWENRRYPSIKKENAEKLAEALEVTLAAILEQEETPPETMTPVEPAPAPLPEPAAQPALSRKPRLPLWLLPLLLVALVMLGLVRFFTAADHPQPVLSAARYLPPHIAPGQVFPVAIKVSTQPPATLALIIREELPPGCRLTLAAPALTGTHGADGQIKWVSRLEGTERLFAYLLTSPSGAALGSTLSFRGQVVAGNRGEISAEINGSRQLLVSPHHWADSNEDNRIDDEEILAVYNQFGDVKEFAALRDEVDKLWTGGGYRWDASTRQYLVVKEAR